MIFNIFRKNVRLKSVQAMVIKMHKFNDFHIRTQSGHADGEAGLVICSLQSARTHTRRKERVTRTRLLRKCRSIIDVGD